VVAVEATLAGGRVQTGTGFLVGGRLVLTAAHCTQNKRTKKPAVALQVVRAGAAGSAPVVDKVVCSELDVAVLVLADSAPWEPTLPAVVFAKVDRSHLGMLENCEGIGYPLFQRDPKKGSRYTSEVHGTIYLTDEAETGRLLMREPLIHPGVLPKQAAGGFGVSDDGPLSPWGGLSGALLFHAGQAIGVVVEHHPRQGDSALRAIGFEKIAKTADTDPDARRIADALRLPGPTKLPSIGGDPVEPLTGQVERLHDGDLPLVRELNPYLAGATESKYATRASSGTRDPYVARTFHDVDARVRASLKPGQMVLLAGPSKAGKTRTAFEAVRTTWPQARLLIPAPKSLAILAKHPRLQSSSDAVVVWLNDLQRYLTGISDPLTPALLTALLSRPGDTIVVATLRTEERARLLGRDDELTREARRVLEEALEIELGPTSDNPDEQAAAQQAYPEQDLRTYGLAEQLAGAPYLLKQYRDALHADPLLYAVIQTAIDWTRLGMPGPIPETDLSILAADSLFSTRPHLDPTPDEVLAKIRVARTPPEDAGRVPSLQTVRLPDRSRGYLAFSYLVAADDGQVSEPRPIPGNLWDEALQRADIDAAWSVSIAAYERHNKTIAVRASRQAAEAGNIRAMYTLGFLLVRTMDPPELGEARRWYEQAANAGHTGAMFNLGNLLAEQVELAEARRWYEQAANAGHASAMHNLGRLAEELDPPELVEACRWYEQAANAGRTDAIVARGNVLVNRMDPPELGEARRWYEQAASAGHTDVMYNLGNLLADRMDPPELGEARRWYEQAADAGDTRAMYSLGNLLADRMDPPELGEARRWYEQAANAGHTWAMNSLGNLLAARMDPPELKGAQTAWEAVINAGAGDAHSEEFGWAALALATLEAVGGDTSRAAELLDLAEQNGVPSADLYKETLSSDPSIRAAAIRNLMKSPKDSDGLNFLGISSYRAGEPDAAKHYWLRSLELGDVYAPLLLHKYSSLDDHFP
jgi:TPR repeat protein